MTMSYWLVHFGLPRAGSISSVSTRHILMRMNDAEMMAGVEGDPTSVDLQARIVGQAANSFIAVACPGGRLVLVDQHAAHERVRLESLAAQVGRVQLGDVHHASGSCSGVGELHWSVSMAIAQARYEVCCCCCCNLWVKRDAEHTMYMLADAAGCNAMLSTGNLQCVSSQLASW